MKQFGKMQEGGIITNIYGMLTIDEEKHGDRSRIFMSIFNHARQKLVNMLYSKKKREKKRKIRFFYYFNGYFSI
jgi:hypothetical protein